MMSSQRTTCRRAAWVCAIALIAVVISQPVASAHDDGPQSLDVRIKSPLADVAGTLLLPHAHDPIPCVVIVGGTLSNDRNGKVARPGVADRDALKRLAEALAVAGYASLRYDKVGHGDSQSGKAWTGSYADEARVAASVIEFARGRPEISKVIVAGESAGAYVACLAAKSGTTAHGYIFLGALCDSSEAMYAYTFGGLAKWAESNPERRAWAEKHCRHDLALGRHYKEMLAAAKDGRNEFELVDGDFRAKFGGLSRRREEFANPPDELFKQIQSPALVLQGEFDLNVPLDNAERAARIMSQAGNKQVKQVTIPGADHSFQSAPVDADERFRERYSLASFERPYTPRLYGEIVLWLGNAFPTSAEGHSPGDVAKATSRDPIDGRAHERSERDAKTTTKPERLVLAPGIEIVEDVTNRERTAGVETLEGRIGPLLLAGGSQAHFIDMPGGMFLAEHPHSTESIIYTVRGQWVLCSGGRRHVMKAGSLYRFTANTPTGYEVPFDENAFILIFKGDRTTKEEGEFIAYLEGMAQRLAKEHKQGTPFLLSELPEDHAARKFAREVNPSFMFKKAK